MKSAWGIASERRAVTALHIAVPLTLTCVFVWRAAGGLGAEVRFSDDFFYYLIPSTNWADGHGSTFFPGEPTNGYHPLWFSWMSFLRLIAPVGPVYFALVDVSLLVLLLGFFVYFDRFLRYVIEDRLSAVLGASISVMVLVPLTSAGLETALAVFSAALLLAFLARKPISEMTARDALVAGALGAFLALARLDSAVLLILIAIVVVPRLDWRRRALLIAGASPLYLYIGMNLAVFGHVGTTSMAAKTLTVYWPPNLWFLSHPSPVAGVAVVAAVVGTAAVIVVLGAPDPRSDARRICLSVAVAPLLQLLAQALTSGWALFPWYFYLLGMGVGLAVALVAARVRISGRGRRLAVPTAIAVLLLGTRTVMGVLTPDPWQADIAAVASRLAAFAADHPGVYAMGDAAGTPAWAMGQPVVHLEGLMMSPEYLDRLRAQQPLARVLRDYGVDYYVNVHSDDSAGACEDVAEPHPDQASPRAPKLTATICAKPVLEFQQSERYLVRVYRIDPGTVILPGG